MCPMKLLRIIIWREEEQAASRQRLFFGMRSVECCAWEEEDDEDVLSTASSCQLGREVLVPVQRRRGCARESQTSEKHLDNHERICMSAWLK